MLFLLGLGAVTPLLPFVSTDLCKKKKMSAMELIKTRQRNYLQLESFFTLAASTVPPEIEKLMSKQGHVSP